MSVANIKVDSTLLTELRRVTGEQTGQRAVFKALAYFLKEARQRRITDVLQSVAFDKKFDPLVLRRNER